jgi:hypothetical protein
MARPNKESSTGPAIMSSGKNKPMSTTTVTPPLATAETRDSWLPMIVIAMGQALMSFNVAALPVSMGGMVASFNTLPVF